MWHFRISFNLTFRWLSTTHWQKKNETHTIIPWYSCLDVVRSATHFLYIIFNCHVIERNNYSYSGRWHKWSHIISQYFRQMSSTCTCVNIYSPILYLHDTKPTRIISYLEFLSFINLYGYVIHFSTCMCHRTVLKLTHVCVCVMIPLSYWVAFPSQNSCLFLCWAEIKFLFLFIWLVVTIKMSAILSIPGFGLDTPSLTHSYFYVIHNRFTFLLLSPLVYIYAKCWFVYKMIRNCLLNNMYLYT